ncbi:MAG TPA: DinB family protein [Acidimicrobiales bacterium]|nr:DinB family protein [Acidimicrobiales bacterium]
MDDEARAVKKSLDNQRAHVLGILEGLSEEMFRRPVLPSGWNCLGLVQHLALEVEHYWFQCIVGGEPLDFFGERSAERSGWHVAPDQSPEDVVKLYREEIERADLIIAGTPLGDPPRQRDEWWGDWQVPDVRFIMLHVIAETACHAGHLDAVRELLDGRQWVVL